MAFNAARVPRSVLAALALLVSAPSQAETATDESIREFFVVSGQEAALLENAQAMLPALRQMSKDMPDDLFRELTRTDTIVAMMVPVYRKYFSEEEMRELIALYKSPTGSKYAKLAGKVQREGFELNARQARMAIINYQVQRGRFTVDPPKQGN